MTTPTAFKSSLLTEVLEYQRSASQKEVTPAPIRRNRSRNARRGIGAGVAAAALVGAVVAGNLGSAAPAAAETKVVAAVNTAAGDKILHMTHDSNGPIEVFTDRSPSSYATLTRFLNADGSIRSQVAYREAPGGSSTRVLDMEKKQYRDDVSDGLSATAVGSVMEDSASIKFLISDGSMKESGKEKINGVNTLKLTAVERNVTIWVDADSFLPVRSVDATVSKPITFQYEWIDRKAAGVPPLFPEVPAGFVKTDRLAYPSTLSDEGSVSGLANTPPVLPLDGSAFYVPQSSKEQDRNVEVGLDEGTMIDGPPPSVEERFMEAPDTPLLPPDGR